jgi:small subunit ribosomal protein S13
LAKPNAGKEKPKKAEEKPKKGVDEELRHIVRILNTDLAGKKQVHMALTGIKGVGRRCAKIFTDRAGVDPFATLGLLPDAEIDKLKKVVEEDAVKILPVWMVNRRGDIETVMPG